MNKNEIINYVWSCIQEVKHKFEINHEFFIDGMEDDILAYLYHLIAREPFFLEERKGLVDDDSTKTKILQVQARTESKIHKQRGRFDLAILDPFEKGNCMNLIAIEMKWIGNLNNQQIKNSIRNDIKKLNQEKNEIERGYLLLFNNKHRFTKHFKNNILSMDRKFNNNSLKKILFINSNTVKNK